MSSFNKCIFLGNLTRSVELKYTPKGTAVAQIGLAINHTWKNDQGQKMEECCFLDIECWGRTAEIANEYLQKGDSALFECRAKLDSWDDKETGKKRSKIKFVCETLQLLGGKKGETRSKEYSQEAPPQRPREIAPQPQDPDLDQPEDDIPF